MNFDPSRNPLNFDLTIGELFPADDLIAQWVFTLNCVVQDIEVVAWPLRDAKSVRAKLYYNRALITRLYEARRLIDAHAKYEEIRQFVAGGLNVTGTDLLALYTRPSEAEKSEVEKLYAGSRHRTVHYPSVGSSELRGLLFDYHKFPARMVPELTDDPAIDTQWVSIVRAQDTWSAPPWSSGFLQQLQEFGAKTGAVSAAWIMANVIFTIKYSRERGIPLERMVGDPELVRSLTDAGRRAAESQDAASS
jgi:hypothetical protein